MPGPLAGDQLLRELCQFLEGNKRSSDTPARLGGDEFALILEGCPVNKSKEVASSLIDVVKKFRFYWRQYWNGPGHRWGNRHIGVTV